MCGAAEHPLAASGREQSVHVIKQRLPAEPHRCNGCRRSIESALCNVTQAIADTHQSVLDLVLRWRALRRGVASSGAASASLDVCAATLSVAT